MKESYRRQYKSKIKTPTHSSWWACMTAKMIKDKLNEQASEQ